MPAVRATQQPMRYGPRFRPMTVALITAVLLTSTPFVATGQLRVMFGVNFQSGTSIISRVIPNSPAAKMGIVQGDELLSIDTRLILQEVDVMLAMKDRVPGDVVRLELLRGDEPFMVALPLVEATELGKRIDENGELIRSLQTIGMAGQPAPVLDHVSWSRLPYDASAVQFEELAGKVVVVFLFQSTSPYCLSDGFPLMAKMHKEHGGNEDVFFMAIQGAFPPNEEHTLENGIAMCDKFDLPIAVGQDNSDHFDYTICKSFQGPGYPWLAVIDREGIIRFNGLPGDFEGIDAVAAILEGSSLPENDGLSEAEARKKVNDQRPLKRKGGSAHAGFKK